MGRNSNSSCLVDVDTALRASLHRCYQVASDTVFRNNKTMTRSSPATVMTEVSSDTSSSVADPVTTGGDSPFTRPVPQSVLIKPEQAPRYLTRQRGSRNIYNTAWLPDNYNNKEQNHDYSKIPVISQNVYFRKAPTKGCLSHTPGRKELLKNMAPLGSAMRSRRLQLMQQQQRQKLQTSRNHSDNW
jgi:hypothetical protein